MGLDRTSGFLIFLQTDNSGIVWDIHMDGNQAHDIYIIFLHSLCLTAALSCTGWLLSGSASCRLPLVPLAQVHTLRNHLSQCIPRPTVILTWATYSTTHHYTHDVDDVQGATD